MTELFTKMVVYIEQKDSMPLDQCVVWLTVLLLIAENFHSLNSQDLPEYFEVACLLSLCLISDFLSLTIFCSRLDACEVRRSFRGIVAHGLVEVIKVSFKIFALISFHSSLKFKTFESCCEII